LYSHEKEKKGLAVRKNGPFPEAIEQVHEGQQRMTQHHARAGIAHHLSNFFPHFGLITVNGAFTATGLASLKGALG